MLSGLCVVACNTGANTEIIRNGENGVLYEYGNISDLKERLLALSVDAEMRRKLSIYGRNEARSKYGIYNNAKDLGRLYNIILGEYR
jgi:glycosyltransferase involved in cell wall biosynthesis